jgi:hypothetical protein
LIREIPLTQGYVAIVDDRDYEALIQHKWRASPGGCTVYAVREVKVGGKRTSLLMHKHKNGNGLDNRRANLRESTHSQNMRNRRSNRVGTSKYVGVSWYKSTGKWLAQIEIRVNGIRHGKCLGYFNSEEDAARARDKAAFERDPEYCRLNFPEEYGR